MFSALYNLAADVGFFWYQRAREWWNKRSPRDEYLEKLDNATSFNDFDEAARQLDRILDYDEWRDTQPCKLYDYKLIRERLDSLIRAQQDNDAITLISLVRAGLVRNLGNITAPKLYNRAFRGTKRLVDQYITAMGVAVEEIAVLPTSQNSEGGWTPQQKMDVLHDSRQAFGRSTLVLQGGAIFGLSHLGVVKALHEHGLLPRIITGTATGALIAALVCIHTEDELFGFLKGDGIDLTAFSRQNRPTPASPTDGSKSLAAEISYSGLDTLVRRVRRYFREGYFLDVNVLESCVRANVGDLTFEEAFVRTKRVLNITVSTSRSGGVPNLLNYLTAPNVLIWSAAVASNTSSTNLYKPATIYCKNENGDVVPWKLAQGIEFRSYHQGSSSQSGRDSPLSRVAELFNVNHFIVSQARPYIAPFLRSDLRHPSPRFSGGPAAILAPCFKALAAEIHHRLRQLDMFGLLAPAARRLLLDETIPGAHITLVPDITVADFSKLLENPTHASLDYWILRGERAVWPAVSALKVRCAIEVKLDWGYQLVRRRKPLEGDASSIRKVRRKEN